MQGPALTNAHIVPGVVDHVDLDDAVSMRVQYGDRLVTTGNELRPSEVGGSTSSRSMTTAGKLPRFCAAVGFLGDSSCSLCSSFKRR